MVILQLTHLKIMRKLKSRALACHKAECLHNTVVSHLNKPCNTRPTSSNSSKALLAILSLPARECLHTTHITHTTSELVSCGLADGLRRCVHS